MMIFAKPFRERFDWDLWTIDATSVAHKYHGVERMRENVLQRDKFLNPPALGGSHLQISLHPQFQLSNFVLSEGVSSEIMVQVVITTGEWSRGEKDLEPPPKANIKNERKRSCTRSFCTQAMVKQDETQYVIRKEVQSTKFRYVDVIDVDDDGRR
jgi:hypothetical protein